MCDDRCVTRLGRSALSTLSRLRLAAGMVADLQATESTPLKSASASATPPSFELAMTRARLRLLRNPETGELYPFLGFCAPRSAFTLLGQGSEAHINVLGYCFYLSLLLCCFGLPLAYISIDPERHLEAGTVGSWSNLRYSQVLCDIGLVVVFGTFFQYLAFYLVRRGSKPPCSI